MGGWVNKFWDHTFLFYEQDIAMQSCLDDAPHRKAFYKCGFDPTMGNMANHLLRVVAPTQMVNTGIEIIKVVLHESENSFIEVEL